MRNKGQTTGSLYPYELRHYNRIIAQTVSAVQQGFVPKRLPDNSDGLRRKGIQLAARRKRRNDAFRHWLENRHTLTGGKHD